MGVNASSVAGALRLLSEKGLVRYESYDVITLTPDGKRMAEELVRRHELLQDFFSRVLSIEPKEAEHAACEMEHALPTPVLDWLIQFVHFLDICPRAGSDGIESLSLRRECRSRHKRTRHTVSIIPYPGSPTLMSGFMWTLGIQRSTPTPSLNSNLYSEDPASTPRSCGSKIYTRKQILITQWIPQGTECLTWLSCDPF